MEGEIVAVDLSIMNQADIMSAVASRVSAEIPADSVSVPLGAKGRDAVLDKAFRPASAGDGTTSHDHLPEQYLHGEILQFTRIIAMNRAALRLRAISDIDKERLLLAIDQRAARLAILQEQLAANS